MTETILHWKYQLIQAWHPIIVQNSLKITINADYKHVKVEMNSASISYAQ